ncbi:unnamed protein product [Kuraishia capsulata CBS 1993]|uniref:PH domain-containing protein n=1 Tax=Kuraishia capsulata CBS 1993 TaxID=1382522 RepID=W6MTE0_9ASCO|nr:uncharacterized protein KUCA_T00005989001 [Kuraishia capsulata CBS 1993]CDK29994.1 unnamed protein product [Kuraishia capsulata CBS 1993]
MVSGLSRIGPVTSHGHHQIIQTNTIQRPLQPLSPQNNRKDPNKILVASYLYRKSATTHNYKKKWFVLRVGQLAEYKDSKEHKPTSVIDVSNLRSTSRVDKKHSNYPHFVVYTNNKKLKLYAESEDIYQSWKSALEKVINHGDESHDESNGARKDEEVEEKEQAEQIFAVPFQKPNVKAPNLETSGHDQFSGVDDPNYTSCASDSFQQSNAVIPAVLPPNTNQQPSLDVIEESLSPMNTKPGEEGSPSSKLTDLATDIQFGSDAKNEILIEQGHLSRLYKTYSQWKKFRIILTNKRMYFYKASTRRDKPIKTIDVNDILDICELDPLSRTRLWCLLIITKKKRIRFCADNEEELLKWIVAIKMVINKRDRVSKASTAT